jgi:Prp8 binding protein
MSSEQVQVYSGTDGGALVEIKAPKKLAASTMQLTGHQGEIYTMKYSSDGQYLASAGFDRMIYFWDVFPQG